MPDPVAAPGEASDASLPRAKRGIAPWHSVRVRASGEARELAMAALFEAGSQGVLEEADALLTHFPPELGSLVVAPPWLVEGRDPARTIVIDPGMAFGTGEHATTRGVVRLMQDVIRSGDLVADLGAGSAVLSIAAAKLGAGRVVAIELDGEAIPDAEENVRVNGVADRVTVFEGDAATLLPLVAPVRVVLANIISSVLVDLLPHVQRALAPHGVAILSGILQEERAHMLSVLDSSGWRVEAEDAEDIWWSATAVRV